MATLYSSHLISSSSHLQISPRIMALKTPRPFLQGLKLGSSRCIEGCGCSFSFKTYGVLPNRTPAPKIFCSINMTAGQSDDSGKTRFDQLMEKARKLWESSPQPVKSFPWNRAFDNFIQLTIDLILAVVKYLSVPLLAVSSLSEMSYCAHERKLKLVPFPLFIGITVAGVLNQAALEVSPLLKDAEVPWHLICVAIFFTLLKLPGPYYPYWGRIFIPHFANGGLFRTLWFAFLWLNMSR
ncbi:embryo defective [Trema orientale]|uniref:Embryo defective n=1 Tax=Trema orientale TaxID=63057 RepID=A0A2P5FZ45_TREOI|nr:embryo defective [Trema orientale]